MLCNLLLCLIFILTKVGSQKYSCQHAIQPIFDVTLGTTFEGCYLYIVCRSWSKVMYNGVEKKMIEVLIVRRGRCEWNFLNFLIICVISWYVINSQKIGIFRFTQNELLQIDAELSKYYKSDYSTGWNLEPSIDTCTITLWRLARIALK
jgi:hypothetical protein